MKPGTRSRLERTGWRVGPAEEYLELTPQEAALVELRLRLADAVKLFRKNKHLTQSQPAKLPSGRHASFQLVGFGISWRS